MFLPQNKPHSSKRNQRGEKYKEPLFLPESLSQGGRSEPDAPKDLDGFYDQEHNNLQQEEDFSLDYDSFDILPATSALTTPLTSDDCEKPLGNMLVLQDDHRFEELKTTKAQYAETTTVDTKIKHSEAKDDAVASSGYVDDFAELEAWMQSDSVILLK